MKIGYALGGGGGKGGFQAGVCYSLHKNGINPSVVSGISVGALNGIMVATGQYEAMKEVWHTITDDQVRKESGPIRYGWKFLKHKIGIGKPQIGYWQSDPLKSLVRDMILGEETVCDYFAGAVNPEENTFHNFYIGKGTKFTEANVDRFVDQIVSSTAIPVIFEPVYINGEMFVDGGIHYQMPLKPISQLIDDVDYIIGISHKGGNYRGQPIADDLDMLKFIIPTLLDQTADQDFERFEMINELCLAGVTEWKGKTRKYYPSKIFRPMRRLSPSTRFHHAYARLDFKHGRQLAKRFTIESVTANI